MIRRLQFRNSLKLDIKYNTVGTFFFKFKHPMDFDSCRQKAAWCNFELITYYDLYRDNVIPNTRNQCVCPLCVIIVYHVWDELNTAELNERYERLIFLKTKFKRGLLHWSLFAVTWIADVNDRPRLLSVKLTARSLHRQF